MSRGKVSFVNQGPGDPSLRGSKAADRIASADVIIDDDDVRVETLFELARDGKHVVRAVAGDVAASSSVAAEMLELAHGGVAIEMIPGVSATGAAAAFAGVLGRAAYVRTSAVTGALRGEPQDAPVTLVVAPGLPSQRVITTTVARAPDRARDLGDERVLLCFGVPDPALQWFERRPLFGKRVLVTRSREQAAGTAALLREHGAEVLVVPTIEIHPSSDRAAVLRAVAAMHGGAYAWVAFTSANGVEQTWQALAQQGWDARAFSAARVAAVGPATASALEAHGLRADVVAKELRGEGLATAMLSAIGSACPRVLIARAAHARDVLPDTLRAAGCHVDVVAVYETRPPPRAVRQELVRELDAGRVDAVTFTSGSTVENLCDLLEAGEAGPDSQSAADRLCAVRVASIGPVTTEIARARGLRVDVTASESTVPGLVAALAQSYE